MRETELWKAAAASVEAGKAVCLIVMVHATGHGPNRPGAKMTVTAGGDRRGTVGGGAAERSLFHAAESALADGDPPPPRALTLEHHGDSGPRASGMICSGTQTFVLLRLAERDLPALRALAGAHAEGRPGCLEITPAGLDFTAGATCEQSWDGTAGRWRYREPAGCRITVTLVGGGHVALALTPLLVRLGFHTVVLDDRPGLDTLEANTLADERRTVDYARIREHVPPGPTSYVCIMTHGHRHDEQLLEKLLGHPLGYLGMMGSPPKVAAIRGNLLARGVPPTPSTPQSAYPSAATPPKRLPSPSPPS
ncbi:MAG: hypothetical protein GXP47_14310 [Acidobacteria bacterium]|nr:hypothetical protein [Acidobacteriota bacterium]